MLTYICHPAVSVADQASQVPDLELQFLQTFELLSADIYLHQSDIVILL